MRKTKNILIVDDSKLIRSIIKDELKNDYEIAEAVNGLEALRMISDNTFIPDLITMDLEMPEIGGFDTCKKLYSKEFSKYFKNQDNNKVPIVFITAHDNLNDRKKGFLLGAADFITKPFSKGDIINTVDKILKPNNRLKNLKVLIVDDSSSARFIIASALRIEGMNVLEAENGIRAYEIICKHMEDIDLVITDLIMPEMGGGELCKKIRTELGLIDLPVIIFTGMADQSEILKIYKAGGTDYINKPFIKEEMLARIIVQLEKAQLNKRLRQTISELRSANKIKDNLLAVSSHDLRSPLTGIFSLSGILLERNDLDTELKEAFSHIKDTSEFMLNLIEDMLNVSRIESSFNKTKMSKLALTEIVETSVNAFKDLSSNKHQKLIFIKNCNNDLIYGNKQYLIRVMNNLLSNAIKFTGENGEISVEIDNNTKYVIIKVIDTGIGIPEEKLDILFDKFTKLSKPGTSGERSTGLGMSIVKKIVEIHNGDIQVESKINSGTTIMLTLPLLTSNPDNENNGPKKTM